MIFLFPFGGIWITISKPSISTSWITKPSKTVSKRILWVRQGNRKLQQVSWEPRNFCAFHVLWYAPKQYTIHKHLGTKLSWIKFGTPFWSPSTQRVKAGKPIKQPCCKRKIFKQLGLQRGFIRAAVQSLTSSGEHMCQVFVVWNSPTDFPSGNEKNH